MPIDLDTPVDFNPPEMAAIGAIKIENIAGQWMDIWITYGDVVDDVFVETVDPYSGTRVQATQIHIEDGLHPLVPNMSLRKCPQCGRWFKLTTECPDCLTATGLYDGWTRLIQTVVSGSVHAKFMDVIYAFLVAEQVPDPLTWVDRPLVKGVVA